MSMTRDEIVSLVTATVGQTDSASVTLCQTYVQRAIEMVWNADLWRDTVTIDTSPTVTAGTNTFNLPAGFDRIVSLQLLSAGVPVGYLDPTTSTFILQTEPTALTVQAVPTKYEEFVHTDGTKKVRVFPLPNASYSFTLSGKRTCPTLAGSDALQIRNVDNAVIALATSDMYTRLRHLGKAAEMAKKAGAFIEEAKSIEHAQSNQARVSKTPTVTTNTFAELIDAVCAKAGRYTPDDVILARNFLKRRYRFIWDKFMWRDTIVSATASTTNGVDYIATPAAIERVTAVTLNNALLDPLDIPTVLQADPTALTASGTPRYFQEIDAAGLKRIQLMPVPDATYSVIVAGKKPITNLSSDSSAPAIKNIDNALIEFATADLMQRLDKPDGAKACLDAANAELQALIELETQQAFKSRQIRPMAVGGNTLEEMSCAVAARTSQYSPESAILIKDFIRRNYQQVYDSTLWTESTIEVDVTSVTSVLVLPEYIDRVISIRGVSTLGQLSVAQPSLFYSINPWIFEQTGDPLAFSYLAPVGVRTLPLLTETIRLVSTSATDKTPVFLRDETLGYVSVNLNGTTPVTTSIGFTAPLTVSKGITTGTVSAVGNTSTLLLVELLPNERERKHIRIRFRPTPTSNVVCKVLCKRKITPLIQDEDSPLLRDIGNVLINLACSDMFSKLGNDKAAADSRSKAGEALSTLIDLEKSQGANSWQVVPDVEPMGNWMDADMWMVAK